MSCLKPPEQEQVHQHQTGDFDPFSCSTRTVSQSLSNLLSTCFWTNFSPSDSFTGPEEAHVLHISSSSYTQNATFYFLVTSGNLNFVSTHAHLGQRHLDFIALNL